MKRDVVRSRLRLLDSCEQCGLSGSAALYGEQQAAVARQVWRHSVCGHVICYRPNRPVELIRLPSVTRFSIWSS